MEDLEVLMIGTSRIYKRGVTSFVFKDNTTLDIGNRGTRCFPQRAILRIAMLLSDNTIAREIRNQLLNTF